MMLRTAQQFAGTVPVWSRSDWSGRSGRYGPCCGMDGLNAPDGLGFFFIPLIISAAIAAASQGAQSWKQHNAKDSATKLGATQFAEKAIKLAQENLRAWQMSGTKYKSEQQMALQTFETIWSGLTDPENGCGSPFLREAGQRCISERQRGGIYDMWKDNYDPIANDPGVRPDPVQQADGSVVEPDTGKVLQPGTGTQMTQALGGFDWRLLAIGGLLAAAVVMGMGRKGQG